MNSFEKYPKEGFGFIYKYTSPSGKSYIGQTVRSLKERAKCDGMGYNCCPIFFAAIIKYKFRNFKHEILGEYPIEELDEKEKYFIKLYNTLVPNGYNATEGGRADYNSKGKRQFAVDQYDINGKFIKSYESLIEAARENNTQYQAISAVLTGKRPQHNGYIYRYSGENAPEPVIVQKTHGKQTAQYDLNGNLIAVYPSANQAAIAIGKDSGAGRNIRSVCAGTRQMAYGFKWKYLD